MSWNESCGLSTVAAHHIGGQDGCIRGRASQAMSISIYMKENGFFFLSIRFLFQAAMQTSAHVVKSKYLSS